MVDFIIDFIRETRKSEVHILTFESGIWVLLKLVVFTYSSSSNNALSTRRTDERF